MYRENQVVLLRGYLGYQIMVEFDTAERIENVAIGDSAGWQVTPNRAGTLLFLKPLSLGAQTNMTVVTNARRYAFELVAREATSSNDPRIMYNVRFLYPPPPTPVRAAAPRDPVTEVVNENYRLSGSRRLGAVRVFDNGRATFFQFPAESETPAIFLLGEDGKEEIVNVQTRGAYVVVDQLAPAFALRRGSQRMIVRNHGFRTPRGAR
jgi:type IV secretion system protein VirB9